jgi:Domain of unknown function (DUF1917)
MNSTKSTINLEDAPQARPPFICNPYAGNPSAYQFSENLSRFLSCLRPSMSTSHDWGPWIYIADPYSSMSSHYTTTDDLAHLLVTSARLLAPTWSHQRTTNISAPERKQLEGSLYALAKEAGCTSGKWMIFVTSDAVDSMWAKVATATAEGKLGVAAKVSTIDEHKAPQALPLICVYTYDFTNKPDIKRVLTKLISLGVAGQPGMPLVIYQIGKPTPRSLSPPYFFLHGRRLVHWSNTLTVIFYSFHTYRPVYTTRHLCGK